MSTALASSDAITTIDPAKGEVLNRYPVLGGAEIENEIARSQAAFERWQSVPLQQRLDPIAALGRQFRMERDRYAHTITAEMGKTIAEARAEVEKCAWACEYYAEHAQGFLAPEFVVTSAARSYAAFRPLGVVLAIMPWNFPFFQVVRFAVPATAAGNVALLKHAANVTGSALALQSAFEQSGFPEHVFRALIVRAHQVADVIADARVAAVTFTGSEAAGAAVASAAGRHLKKSVLELGGSDAFIVLADADVDAAAATAVRARFQNCGQSCIAAKRFIVERPVYERFCEAFTEHARRVVTGDPLDEATTMGPLAREDLARDIERQVGQSASQGAQVLLGGNRLKRPGAFYEPTILKDVRPGMAAFDEETFGPAAAIASAADASEAIALANCTSFGLGNSLWTGDLERAEALATMLQSGLVFVNSMTASDPRLPFGGVKRSGYGRELAQFGIREFTNVQTVSVAG